MFKLKNEFNAKQYIENFFYIVDRDRNKIPFIFNKIQDKLFEKMGRRTLVLKYRKGGISSEILALWDCACMLEDNTRAVVISHEKEATQRLLDRVYFYNDNLAIKPNVDRESVNEIRYKDTRSSFYIGTAGSKSFGRGDDITHLHISEFDWWENTDMLTGLLEACVPGAWVVIETTANGFNSQFHKLWKLAKNNKNDWLPLFLGWNESEDCRSEILETGFKLTDDEDKLKLAYNLDDNQIEWRRQKLRSMDRPELLPQEFPINDVEAFMFSGRNFFPADRLKLYLDNCVEPLEVGELKKTLDRIEFLQNPKGSLSVYKKPDYEKVYVIGADSAEGLGQDFSCASVYCPEDDEVVATFKADIEPSEFGRELAKLGQYYGWALIAAEVNNHGLTTLITLKDGEKYPNIYYRESVDKATNTTSQKIGWKTTETTRPLLLDKLDKAIRDGLISVKSKDIVEQLMSFIIDRNGKAQAVSGGHDDFVFSTAIAYFVKGKVVKKEMENFNEEPRRSQSVFHKTRRF